MRICHFCCDEEGGNAAGVAIFVRENGGQKSEEKKERDREKRGVVWRKL
jgi:hypothetical protein